MSNFEEGMIIGRTIGRYFLAVLAMLCGTCITVHVVDETPQEEPSRDR